MNERTKRLLERIRDYSFHTSSRRVAKRRASALARQARAFRMAVGVDRAGLVPDIVIRRVNLDHEWVYVGVELGLDAGHVAVPFKVDGSFSLLRAKEDFARVWKNKSGVLLKYRQPGMKVLFRTPIFYATGNGWRVKL